MTEDERGEFRNTLRSDARGVQRLGWTIEDDIKYLCSLRGATQNRYHPERLAEVSVHLQAYQEQLARLLRDYLDEGNPGPVH